MPTRCKVHQIPSGGFLDSPTLALKADWDYGRSQHRRHYVVEAWLDGELCGRAFGWFVPQAEFVMEKIEIVASHRSRGYGSAVIAHLREKAREQRCVELVFKGVRASNSGAIRLYESLGAVGVPTSDDLISFVLSPP